MGLCRPGRCGCRITSSTLSVQASDQGFNIESYDGVTTEANLPGVGVRFEGMKIWTSDTKRLLVWNATAGAWQILSEPPQAWNQTTITQGATVTGTVTRGWSARRNAALFDAHLTLAITSSGTAANSIFVPSPFTLPNANDIGGTYNVYDASAALAYSGVIVPISTTVFAFQAAGGALGASGFVAALVAGDSVTVDISGRYA